MTDEADEIWRSLIAYEEKTYMQRGATLSSVVHYTSFASLKGILDTQELWFSSASTTNDFLEISRGKAMLERMSAQGQPLFAAIDAIRQLNPQLWETLNTHYRNRHFGDLYHTYISCWSECDLPNRSHDNLAMWRGYAADGNGVAIVVDALQLTDETDPLSDVVMCPVFYETEAQFADRANQAFELFRQGMAQHKDRVDANINVVANAFGEICFYLAVTHKHPGFAPEKEWRFAWSKHRDPSEDGPRRHLRPVMINGDMIEKFCLPLKTDLSITPIEINLQKLVQSIMIGPAPDIVLKRDAVVNLLKSKGFSNAEQIVVYTEIPYRSKR